MLYKVLKHSFDFGLIPKLEGFAGWRLVKQSRALSALFKRVAPLVIGRFTPNWATGIWNIVRHCVKLAAKQGGVGLVKNLKVLSILTQQAAGGYKVPDLTSLGCRVSRTKSGVPRVICKAHRKAILDGNVTVIRMYLTMFGLYRIIEIPGKVKVWTITKLSEYRQGVWIEHCSYIAWFWSKLRAYLRGRNTKVRLASVQAVQESLHYENEESSNPTLRPDRILPIQSAGPLTSGAGYLSFIDPLWIKKDEKAIKRISFLEREPDGQGFVLGLWRGLRPSEVILKAKLDKAWKGVVPSSVGTLFYTVSVWMNSGLLPVLIEWCKVFDVRVVKDLFRTAYTVRFGQLVPWGQKGNMEGLGKLAFLDEPAGKVRVVAMVDVVTQSILHPLHDWIFRVLKELPMDGTFDQGKPLDILIAKEVKEVYSYDLSSATDRLPLALQESLLGWVLGEKVARLWASLLVNRIYSIHPRTAEKRGLNQTRFSYACGQPMGAYSSWAMLALTHHFCVQLAASRVYGKDSPWFVNYAVLGDDIVLADGAVAREYLKLMTKELKVEIQETKSLLSRNGSFEFAKRTVVRGVDATPISLKGFLAGMRNIATFEGVLAKIPGIWENRLSAIARACGFGYKTLSSLQGCLKSKSRLRGLMVFLTRPGGLLSSRFVDWISMDTPSIRGLPMDRSCVASVLQSMIEWVEGEVRGQIEKRRKNFDKKAGGGWVPTLPFPTRTLFDLYQKLVLRPISVDLMNKAAELEVLISECKEPNLEDSDKLEELFTRLSKVLEEVNALPKDARVARCEQKDSVRPPRPDKSVGLWQRYRRLVRKG